MTIKYIVYEWMNAGMYACLRLYVFVYLHVLFREEVLSQCGYKRIDRLE